MVDRAVALHIAHAARDEGVRVDRDELREIERAVNAVALRQEQTLGKVDVLTTKLDSTVAALEARVGALEAANVKADDRAWVEKLLWAAVGALGGGGAVATVLQSFRAP